MLLNVVCFLSLGVCWWIVSVCSGCVGCWLLLLFALGHGSSQSRFSSSR